MSGSAWTYEDTLLRQMAARIAENKREFYLSAPVVEFSRMMESVSLPQTAAWELVKKYGGYAAVQVKVKHGGVTLGGQINGSFHCAITGIENGIPATDYADTVARIEFLCEDLRRSLLSNLAKHHLELLEANP